MKRHRRGLGSGAVEHQARALSALDRAGKMAAQSIRHARAGRCTDALDGAIAAARNYGQALAEREAGAHVYGAGAAEVGILHVKRELRACFRGGGR
jgi:hypothetical protein